MITVFVRTIVTREITTIGFYDNVGKAVEIAKRFSTAGWMTWIGV